ncbi:sodium-coupled monocarboxylate transporter 1-like [Amblyomma americanum]
MVSVVEYVVFGTLMTLNFGLGLYFVRRKANSPQTTKEVFLGSRTLRAFPLAASIAASLISSTTMVGLAGHFYAYGFHFIWTSLVAIPAATVSSRVFLPVMYELQVTSVFQYVRMRFNSAVSLTASAVYVIVLVSIGALSIFAASITVVTVLGVPLLWCNISIGLWGTIYTAMGGLRGVVWTDCMQLFFILLGPATVITKVVIDLSRSGRTELSLADFEVRRHIVNSEFSFTDDENAWVVLSSVCANLYRGSMDQVVMQRCLASRTLASAQRTLFTGSLLLATVYIVELVLAIAVALWFQGCDPNLSGAIKSRDQILPFYIKTYLKEFPGFTGLFLSAVVSAATSTISSVINSLAAVIYVDVLTPRVQNIDSHLLWITRALALLLGGTMIAYSCLCVYMGSITKAMIMVYNAAAGPFLGLGILAVAFPFVHSKGAGISTLLIFSLELALIWQALQNGTKPPNRHFTLEHCFDNATHFQPAKNITAVLSDTIPGDDTGLPLPSPFWTCTAATFATVITGVLASLATGEYRKRTADITHLNIYFVRLWRMLGVLPLEKRKKGMPETHQEENTFALMQDLDPSRESAI